MPFYNLEISGANGNTNPTGDTAALNIKENVNTGDILGKITGFAAGEDLSRMIFTPTDNQGRPLDDYGRYGVMRATTAGDGWAVGDWVVYVKDGGPINFNFEDRNGPANLWTNVIDFTVTFESGYTPIADYGLNFRFNIQNVNEAPSFVVASGQATHTSTGGAVVSPFAGITLDDPENADILTFTIAFTDLNGALGNIGNRNNVTVVDNGVVNGVRTYTLTGTESNINAYLDAVTFDPINTATTSTNFTFTVKDATNNATTYTNAVTVNSTVVQQNQAPTFAVAAGQSVFSTPAAGAVVNPFVGITVDDPNTADILTLTISYTNVNGLLSFGSQAGVNVGQPVDANGIRTYTITGTAANLNTFLDSVTFDPRDTVATVTRFTFTIKDPSTPATQYVDAVTVNGTLNNLPPTTPDIVDNVVLPLTENQAGAVNVATVRSTDDNVGGTTLQYELVSTLGGLFSVNQQGVITFNGTSQDYENNPNLTVENPGTPQERKYFNVQVRAKESGPNGQSSDVTVVKVYLNNVNEAPNTPSYTSGPVLNENAEVGDVVGTLTATDPDGTRPGFVFVDSDSTVSADGAFRIVLVGNVYQIQVADRDKIQVTSGGSRTFTYAVKATDGELQSANSRTVTITVNDVVQGNEPPVIEGAGTAITRTTSDRANIQAFTGITIRDAGELEVIVSMDSWTKGKFVGAGGIYDEEAGTFTIRGSASFVTDVLRALQFDARDKPTGHAAEVTTFTIKVTDNGGNGLTTINENISVSATTPNQPPQNQAPNDILVTSGGTVQELAGASTAGASIEVATLGAQDPDDASGFVYSIVNPDGRFTIRDNKIYVANGVMLDFEQNTSHVVRVRVTDKSGAGRSFEKNITINVSDLAQETMTAANASPLNDIIKGSQTGNFKDTFFGGAGDDQLWGGYGNDTLWGGVGKDVFVFHGKLGTSKTDRKVNFDTIKDYSVKDDSIWLEADLFKSNKTLYKAIKKATENKPLKMASKFFTVGDKAKDRDDYFVYDAKKRVLSYDADGSGSKAAIEMAIFTKNKALKNFKFSELFFI